MTNKVKNTRRCNALVFLFIVFTLSGCSKTSSAPGQVGSVPIGPQVSTQEALSNEATDMPEETVAHALNAYQEKVASGVYTGAELGTLVREALSLCERGITRSQWSESTRARCQKFTGIVNTDMVVNYSNPDI